MLPQLPQLMPDSVALFLQVLWLCGMGLLFRKWSTVPYETRNKGVFPALLLVTSMCVMTILTNGAFFPFLLVGAATLHSMRVGQAWAKWPTSSQLLAVSLVCGSLIAFLLFLRNRNKPLIIGCLLLVCVAGIAVFAPGSIEHFTNGLPYLFASAPSH